MASWDTPVVNAPTTANYAPPVQDFSSIANLLQDFVKGRQAGREEEKAQVFRNGIPKVGGSTDPNAPIDIGAVTDKLAKINPDYAMPLINMQMQGQMGQQAASAITGQPPGAAQSAAPQVATTAPQPQPRAAIPQQSPASPQGDQPGSIISMIPDGVGPDATGQIASQVANAFRLDPNAAPPADMIPRIRAKIASLTGQPVGVGPQAVSTAPEPAPQTVAQAAPAQTPQPTPADKLDAEATYIRSRAATLSAVNPKAAEVLNKEADTRADKAKQLRDQAADAPAIKEWRQSGSKLPYGEWVAEAESDKATAGERAKANVKEQQEYIDAGKQAGNRLTTLNTIGNIVNSDKNLTLGFGADTALKVKMALQQLGVPVGDLSGAEGIQKMNAALASEMAKSLSGRPTQFEFKSFMANNPGLLLDKSGNQRLIGIYSQLAQREYELGKLARQNGDNWSSWDNVVEKYDAKHPIVDPISKQPISTNSVIAPGPAKGTAAASAPAAPAQEGAMAINPKTGERLKLQGGKWVPFA